MRASLYTTSQLSKDTKLFCHSVWLKRNTFFVNVGHLRKKTLQLVLACAAFNLQPLKNHVSWVEPPGHRHAPHIPSLFTGAESGLL